MLGIHLVHACIDECDGGIAEGYHRTGAHKFVFMVDRKVIDECFPNFTCCEHTL